MRFYSPVRAATAFTLGIILTAGTAAAFPRINLKTLKNSGAKISTCPTFLANTPWGLSTGIVSRNAICGSGFTKVKQLKKIITTKVLPLAGNANLGTPFPDIVDQEGDVQTQPFQVVNYPAIIHYSVSEADFSSTFRMAVVDAETGKEKFVFLRSRGSLSGDVAWNYPGRYYFKMNGYGNEKLQNQPIYSVSITFMDEYLGTSVAPRDLKDAGVSTKVCPKQFIDTETGKLYNIGRGYLCSKQDPMNGGTTPSPWNAGSGLFMANEVSLSGAGDGISLPFRVSGPTNFNYSVYDPTGGKGGFKVILVDLATYTQTPLVDVKGSIDSTDTSINIPGDYFVLLQTRPSDPEKNGEIEWNIDVVGGD